MSNVTIVADDRQRFVESGDTLWREEDAQHGRLSGWNLKHHRTDFEHVAQTSCARRRERLQFNSQ